MEAPGEGGLEQGEGGALLRGGFKAMEVYRERREHGKGRHKNVSKDVVGCL